MTAYSPFQLSLSFFLEAKGHVLKGAIASIYGKAGVDFPV